MKPKRKAVKGITITSKNVAGILKSAIKKLKELKPRYDEPSYWPDLISKGNKK